MAERMPDLVFIGPAFRDTSAHGVIMEFDQPLTDTHFQELHSLIKLKFSGQLRRDPNAPQTAPAQPGQEDAAAERST